MPVAAVAAAFRTPAGSSSSARRSETVSTTSGTSLPATTTSVRTPRASVPFSRYRIASSSSSMTASAHRAPAKARSAARRTPAGTSFHSTGRSSPRVPATNSPTTPSTAIDPHRLSRMMCPSDGTPRRRSNPPPSFLLNTRAADRFTRRIDRNLDWTHRVHVDRIRGRRGRPAFAASGHQSRRRSYDDTCTRHVRGAARPAADVQPGRGESPRADLDRQAVPRRPRGDEPGRDADRRRRGEGLGRLRGDRAG